MPNLACNGKIVGFVTLQSEVTSRGGGSTRRATATDLADMGLCR